MISCTFLPLSLKYDLILIDVFVRLEVIFIPISVNYPKANYKCFQLPEFLIFFEI